MQLVVVVVLLLAFMYSRAKEQQHCIANGEKVLITITTTVPAFVSVHARQFRTCILVCTHTLSMHLGNSRTTFLYMALCVVTPKKNKTESACEGVVRVSISSLGLLVRGAIKEVVRQVVMLAASARTHKRAMMTMMRRRPHAALE